MNDFSIQILSTTPEEAHDILSRGFIVKEGLGFWIFLRKLFYNAIFGMWILMGITFLFFYIRIEILVLPLLVIYITGLLLRFYHYLHLRKILITSDYSLFGGSLIYSQTDLSRKMENVLGNSYFTKIWKSKEYTETRDSEDSNILYVLSILGFILLLVVVSENSYFLWGLICYGIIGAFILYTGVSIFSPLYRFLGICYKLQVLTCSIGENSSSIIIANSDILKEGSYLSFKKNFQRLSRDFRLSINLVIALDALERRVNNGNLFDSILYISGVKKDILHTIVYIRDFFLSQREKVIHSQGELQNLRMNKKQNIVESHIQFSSVRVESLIVELDSNINKLNIMISDLQA